ncbi:hypothetical protein UUU_01330 [Klebsiella pneumoniae subsp. pneumoniae DSM 30104 = JCM 1662 = NBRC 14940]|nr:hypothetical protein UUU_01330 [Klebsiella pneumoniae subsp. pneumoniae DSM 30104 = JCM 1662 = NBRC 14940]
MRNLDKDRYLNVNVKKKGNKRNPTHRRLLHQRALRSAPVIINLLIASH